MSKTEDIEARLAAYIDGELDAAQRAEIEKHLAAHPKHRALIEELMVQKDFLKALPRQAAPADLAEAFTAQLERAVLLGDVDSTPVRRPMRIGFFHQFRAIAAVLMLTVGLAGLIYYLLPRPHEGESALADLRTAQLPPVPEVGLERDSRAELPSEPVAVAMAPAPIPAPETRTRLNVPAPATQPTPPEAPITVAVNDAASRDLSGAASTPLLERADRTPTGPSTGAGFASESAFSRLLDEQKNFTTPLPQGNEMVVLKAQDMDVANLEVIRYLDNNNIRWDAQSEPMPGPLGLRDSQTAMLSRLQQQNVEIKGGPPAEGAGGRGRGGRGGAGAGEQVGQQSQQLMKEQSVSQRIVARQMPRPQARQVVADLNQLQSKIGTRGSFDAAKSIDITPSVIPSQAAARPAEAAQQPDMFQSVIGAARGADSVAPATLPSNMRMLPADPFSFTSALRDPLSLTIPVRGPEAQERQTGPSSPRATPDDLVDVVIVLEPETPVEPPAAAQPAIAPAP